MGLIFRRLYFLRTRCYFPCMEHKLTVRIVLESAFPEEVTAVDTLGSKDIEKVVDEDIAQFNDFFVEDLGNANLTGVEKAAIKTYLGWKLRVFKP